jgi:D-alanyl-lipoteichoic acid acyltransferase DltB (MBOAT superfamily)
VLAYAAQIYCDFSGYSDLAIGTAKWFGFELPQNFNFPYLAKSIADFWNRWHMSLSTWMRDYLYIPLGGSRKGPVRTYFNLAATMTLCGLWHGASWNFILWGFYNGVLLCAHRLYDRVLTGWKWADAVRGSRVYRATAVLTTLLLVFIGLVMVRSQCWSDCWRVEGALLGVGGWWSEAVPTWVPLLIGLTAVGHLYGGLGGRRFGLLDLPPLVRAAAYVAAMALLVVFGPGTTKAFIYFQF